MTEALKMVIDPELGVNIVDLGLIYGVKVQKGTAIITMTLTTPGCPLVALFETMVKEALKNIPGIKGVRVIVTFNPPWDLSKAKPEVRAAIGL